MKNIFKFYKGLAFALFLSLVFTTLAPSVEASFFSKIRDRGGKAAAVGSLPASQKAESCDTPIYARIKFSNDPSSGFGIKNWGTGNLTKKVYVGGNTAADVYDSGEWFVLHDGTTFKDDADILAYENVDGLAVERSNEGAVRIVLHGSWTQPQGQMLTNRERVQASLEFSTDKKRRSATIVPLLQIGDKDNKVDFVAGKNTNHPEDDRMTIKNNLSQFKFVVTTNDDGFYTTYRHSKKDCVK